MSTRHTAGRRKPACHGSPVVVSAALLALQRSSADASETVDLAELIERAAEAHRPTAFARGVRLAFCCLDEVEVLGSEQEVSASLETMIGEAMSEAIAGTRIECSVARESSDTVVRLRFLRPTARCAGRTWEVAGREVTARWPVTKA